MTRRKFIGSLGGSREGRAPDGFEQAARAIMTTDTYPKIATRQAEIGGAPVTINGIAKGAGMIAPDMATMLASSSPMPRSSPPCCRGCCCRRRRQTFNAITIDGDTSTSDTLLAVRHGRGASRGRRASGSRRPAACRFPRRSTSCCAISRIKWCRTARARTKFVDHQRDRRRDAGAARRIALSIANSPLVKTAIAGEDPNWGRIVMAVGKAGEAADRDKLAICVRRYRGREGRRGGARLREAPGANYMKRPEIVITSMLASAGRADGVDLRSHARLHRHQCRLPVLTPHGAGCANSAPPGRGLRAPR